MAGGVGRTLPRETGMFTLRYEYGHDRIDGSYNTVGGFINVGFQLENLLRGESPFSFPEPVFRSSRDLRRLLGLKVKRNRHQPTATISSRTNALSGCVNPTSPQGPVSVGPGFNNPTGVFLPFPSGCVFTSAYFAGATTVLVDITVTNPGLSTDRINGFWANESSAAAAPAIFVTGKGPTTTFLNVSVSHSIGYLPSGDISGIFFVTAGGSWTLTVSNIRVIH